MKTSRGISRRSFLRRSAELAVGAAGFPYIIPGSALGLNGAVAPSNRITLASIGVGGQGSYDTQALMSLPDTQYVALCDVDSLHLEKAKGMVEGYYKNKGVEHPNLFTTKDFREVLARDDVDAVMIATPDFWHAVITVAACKAGKDIYCEKPLAHSVAEGRAVVNAVRRHGRVLQTGSHERSRDNARYMCELVQNGRIGKLHTIRVNMPVDNHAPTGNHPPMEVPPELDYEMWLGPAPWEPYTKMRTHFYFRYILDYSGGEMTDRGAHILDLAQLGSGHDGTGPVSVEGQGIFPQDGLFDTAMSYSFTFEYANGVKIIGESKPPRGIRFEGDLGWVEERVHQGDLFASHPSILKEVIGANEIHLGRSRGHHADFIECVKTRNDPKAPVEVGHGSATMCHIANIALRLGRKLQWNPDTEQFVHDDEANRLLAPRLRAPWHV
jgi:predicted dehydrogenase